MWYVSTMEYYSAIKNKEIIPLAATWMGLDTVILTEVSQIEKGKYIWFCLCVESKKRGVNVIDKPEGEPRI